MAGIRITLKETGQQSIARLWVYNPNEEKEPDYLIHFRRPETYNGEFGFDWMRDNYKEICSDYEKLKKEYYDAEKNEKVELGHKEYFVPWLSMFPKQEEDELKQEVKLKIEIETLNNYQIQDDDYIEIPSKAGIRFNPDTFKVSEINENTLVEVICETPLIIDTTIEVFSKNNKCIVGKLNVFKNDISYKLNVRFVEVKLKGRLQKQTNNIKNILDFSQNVTMVESPILPNGKKIESLKLDKVIANWKEYIKEKEIYFKQMFKQSLIEYEPIKNKKGKIDFREIEINFGNYIINSQNEKNRDKINIISIDLDAIVCDLTYFLECLKEVYKSKYEQEKGVTVFIMPIITRFPDETNNGKIDYHDGIADDIFSSGRYILMAYKSDNFRDSTLVHEAAHTLGLVHSFQERTLDNGREVVSQHIFEYGTTDNIMDYSLNSDTFWKWQWKKMQEDTNDLEIIKH